ncbi:LuxR C-terminal-related transcriptional regulator [Saccharibacillus sp. JS10]|uniref:LuxR C-terminal-related transcriptional regulator n=1 Tax=Saccharibacillus sp. JS10 TaxID=2950552 RepID=UPI00210AF7F9|nr:LuxR C-terminal-related transcriptional regulator [Saccharibacillus sp. JS10]MCQ4087447.1 LuxR C-terminal-related transcriptional regulator [Saccharibacillus sp. JS10]
MHLSEKEKEVAILVAEGMKDVEIAQTLFISRRRVGEIIFSIKDKWEIASRVQIGILACHLGWICPPVDALSAAPRRRERRLTHA